MTLKTIALAAALAVGGGAFAATPKTPAGTPANPHPDSPTSLLREAKQGSDATGPAAAVSASPDTAASAGSGKSVKRAAKKSKKRKAVKPAA